MSGQAQPQPIGLSRSGLILGAAALAGAGVMASLPATAAAVNAPARTQFRPVELTVTEHPNYNRRHFDRARAIAVVSNPVTGKTMTLRVEDVIAHSHNADAKTGSTEWSAGFSALLTRTKGHPLNSGTYPTTINGRTFPLSIVRVGEHTYHVGVDRRTPKQGG